MHLGRISLSGGHILLCLIYIRMKTVAKFVKRYHGLRTVTGKKHLRFLSYAVFKLYNTIVRDLHSGFLSSSWFELISGLDRDGVLGGVEKAKMYYIEKYRKEEMGELYDVGRKPGYAASFKQLGRKESVVKDVSMEFVIQLYVITRKERKEIACGYKEIETAFDNGVIDSKEFYSACRKFFKEQV